MEGITVVSSSGAPTDLGKVVRDHRAEEGTNFERIHIDAIRCVLRGDLDEAKKVYGRLLDRAHRATAGRTLRPEEEWGIALESGNFERAFKIFEIHGTNHYGGILARYLGDEERAVELFNRQIKDTICSKDGGQINYGHAAAVAETKRDMDEVIDILTQGNYYADLIKIAKERPDLKQKIEERVREIQDRYINHASGLSMNSPQLMVREGISIWKEYGISSWELMQSTILDRFRSRTDYVSYVSNDKKTWLSEARSMVHTAAVISIWLDEQEKTRTLYLVAYKFAEIMDKTTGMADDAVELKNRELLENVLRKLNEEREDVFQKIARRNVLIALGKFDEALVTAQGFDKRYVLEKAERWEELCTGFERGEFDPCQTGNGKIEAYTIAAEHGLQQRADQLYSTLVRERKRARDKFGFYDLVGIIIQRNDQKVAQEAIQKARAELFSCQEIDDYEARRLNDMAVLARFVNDTQVGEIFTFVSELYNLEDPLTKHKPEGESIPKTWEREVMLPLRRYEKYVREREN